MTKYESGAPMRGSTMSSWQFGLRHLFHNVVWGNSSDGRVLVCNSCGVVNHTHQQEIGSSRNLKSFKNWKAFHEKHGTIENFGGGTFEFHCSCGSSY